MSHEFTRYLVSHKSSGDKWVIEERNEDGEIGGVSETLNTADLQPLTDDAGSIIRDYCPALLDYDLGWDDIDWMKQEIEAGRIGYTGCECGY